MDIKTEIIAHHASGSLPQLMIEKAQGHRNDEEGAVFRRALIDAHNEGTIDVLEPARTIEAIEVPNFDFFLVQDVYIAIIPDLEAPLREMMDAIRALVARGGNDLTAARPNGAFRQWAAKGDRALETIEQVDPEDAESGVFLFLALQAVSESRPALALQKAIEFLLGPAAPARSAAAMALGTLGISTLDSASTALAVLETARSTYADDNLTGHIVRSAAAIGLNCPDSEDAALDLIAAAARDAGDQTIHQSASMLFFNAEELSVQLVSALSAIVRNVRIENRGTIGEIDNALSVLIRKGRLDPATELLESLLVAHHELHDFELLRSTRAALLALDPEILARIVVEWLRSLDRNLGEAAHKLTGGQHNGPLLLEFDASSLGLSEQDIILLAHRAIGFLFVHPITAASLLLSLIRIASPEARNAICEILFDPLLINFSGELAEWLTQKAAEESDPAAPSIKNVLSQLESYLEGLRRVGPIKELRPSERERLIESHRQHESMRQLHKAVEKKSVLMSLASRSTLLYGTRSISYFEGPDGSKRRIETKLHGISHSVETPRLDVLEPFDLDYTLRVFRAMRAVS